MLYRKNVLIWERALRVIAGALMVVCGLYFLKMTPLGYLVAASGIFTALTGFVGFCPMCYVGGRQLKSKA